MNYHTRNLGAWIAKCIQSDVTILSTKNKMFWEIFEELDWTCMTLGAHLTEYVRILFKCFKLRQEPDFDNVPKFLKAANERIETLQEIQESAAAVPRCAKS